MRREPNRDLMMLNPRAGSTFKPLFMYLLVGYECMYEEHRILFLLTAYTHLKIL